MTPIYIDGERKHYELGNDAHNANANGFAVVLIMDKDINGRICRSGRVFLPNSMVTYGGQCRTNGKVYKISRTDIGNLSGLINPYQL